MVGVASLRLLTDRRLPFAEREDLVAINARMDEEIAKGEDTVKRLTSHADTLEDENEKRRLKNEAMRERIRKMREQLAEMKK